MWGLYNCPYRLYDVDDLIVNTSGALLGWLLARPVARLLPALETLDGRALLRRPVPFGRRLAALVVDLAGYVLATVCAGVVMAPQDVALPAWLLVGTFVAWFVLPLLAALFLAVLIVLDEPWPSSLFALAHDTGARGAAAVLGALGPVELLAVAAGFALTATCALETLRHPDLLGPHDHASGIRNAAPPHSRAAVADEQPPVPDPVRMPETTSGAR